MHNPIQQIQPNAGELGRPAPGGSLIQAETDEQAIAAWLRARASKSAATFDRYRREAERFLRFVQTRHKCLATVTLDDIHSYEQALLAGQITGRPRTAAAVDGVFAVLGSMLGLLCSAGYLHANVMVMREKRSESGDIRVERFLSNDELTALFQAAGELGDRPRDERLRFVLVWFLSTGARVSETLTAAMNSVYLAQEAGEWQWIWRVTRKGGRRGDVPLRDDAMDALARYRQHLELPHFPAPHRDEGYLVWPLRGDSKRPLFRGTISGDLKDFFFTASEFLSDTRLRDHMAQATAHWLRHTSATQLLDAGASMRFVSKLLGHSSQNITSRIYDHADRQQWRQELQRGPSFDLPTRNR